MFKGKSIEAQMDEEMCFHLEMQTAENLEAGMAPDEARQAALRAFGGVDQLKEICRDQRGTRWVSDFVQDLRYGVRDLRKSPAFTTVVVLTLALGTGVNAAIFSIVNDQVIRPFIRDVRGRLVSLYTLRKDANSEALPLTDKPFTGNSRPFSYREFSVIRESKDIFSDVCASEIYLGPIVYGDDVRRTYFELTSESYFSLFDIQPLKGRFFSAAEARPNARIPVVVVSYLYWTQLGSPPDLIGRTVRIVGRNCTVIGITPRGFCGIETALGPILWMPLGMEIELTKGWPSTDATVDLMDPGAFRFFLIASLHPHVSSEVLRAGLDALDRRLASLPGPDSSAPRKLVIGPIPRIFVDTQSRDESIVPDFAAGAMGSALIVLLMACMNLATMFLARGTVRNREIAIRLSLGASRARVLRQLLTEGLLLSLAGSALGLVIGQLAMEFISRFYGHISEMMGTFSFSFHAHPLVDWRVMVFMCLCCVGAALAFSLGPALHLTRMDLVRGLHSLQDPIMGSTDLRRFFSFRNCLVMVQIAFSLMLLFAGALFLRGTLKLGRNLGFETKGRIVANVDLGYGLLPDPKIRQVQREVMAKLSHVSGVERIALSTDVPFTGLRPLCYACPSTSEPGSSPTQASLKYWGIYANITSGYFSALGIKLVSGREFTEQESTSQGPPVVIIDELLARQLFGNQSPLGRRMTLINLPLGVRQGADMEVVGVVRSPHNAVFGDTGLPRIYRPFGQVPIWDTANTYLPIRISPSASAANVLNEVRRQLSTLDPSIPMVHAQLLSDYVDNNVYLWEVRMAGLFFGLCGGIALLLGIVGVYGIKTYTLASRRREFGIRMALGANPFHLFVIIMGQGALQTALAVVVGTGLALVAGRLLSRLVYHVSASDPAALIGAAGCLTLASLISCYLPAMKAVKTDPLSSLRIE